MKNRKGIKYAALFLIAILVMGMLSGCNIELSNEVFTLGTELIGSKTLKYRITNEEEGIDGIVTFKYVSDEETGLTKMQSYADFQTFDYKAEVIFNTETLLPVSSYKGNSYFDGSAEDWSVTSQYGSETVEISATQEEENAVKSIEVPAQYIDNEMINLVLGCIELSEGAMVDINVLISESALFAPYTITNVATETVTVGEDSYECVKYTAKYAGFSLFTAKVATLWFTNDDARILVRYENNNQIMELLEVTVDEEATAWLFEK
jgi:hypothetical protein